MKRSRRWQYLVLSLIMGAGALFAGCGSSSSDGGVGGTGTASLSLTDATIDGVQAIYVTIEEVSVHKEGGGGWETIAEPARTFNLLKLVNGVREELGIAELETGRYTQLRMKVSEQPDEGINILSQGHPYGNYVIDNADHCQELKIPSGYQTGMKVVCGFDINEDQTTELILDFDASRSIVEAGSSGELLLKPTIKVLEAVAYAIVRGTVADEEQNGLPGVLVSAQIFDPSSGDPKDEVVVQASTITDETGSYAIFLAPDTGYNLVASQDGYSPACAEITPLPHSSNTENLQLDTASTGTVSGDVAITDGSPEQHVTISFRQSVQCNGHDTDIELNSVNVVKNGDYSESLPVGVYTVVASSYQKTTQSFFPVEIKADEDTVLDLPL
jgi:hypothetical protein